MVNIKTPADTFCQQFFTNLFVIYWAAEIREQESQLLSLQNPSSLSIQYFIIK